jgi:hypothetical protein
VRERERERERERYFQLLILTVPKISVFSLSLSHSLLEDLGNAGGPHVR